MMNVIGLDFEAAQSNPSINTWNTHYMEPIQVGMYSYFNKESFESTIKSVVHLSDFHKKKTPHLTQEVINNSPSNCDVAEKMTQFFKRNCKDGCIVATYGQSDYKWLMQMYFGCKDKRKDLNIIQHDVYQAAKFDENKINLKIVDVNDLVNIKYPLFKNPTLSNIYKKVTGKELEGNHDALADAKAVAKIFDDDFSTGGRVLKIWKFVKE